MKPFIKVFKCLLCGETVKEDNIPEKGCSTENRRDHLNKHIFEEVKQDESSTIHNQAGPM